jgi:hypothetical protein
VIALFSKDEINIASKTRMNTVFLGCKPLKSSEDEIDLLQSSYGASLSNLLKIG